MRLSTFIRENLEPILQEWEDFAASFFGTAQNLDSATLRDHAKEILEAIAADLDAPESAEERAEKAKGHRPHAPPAPAFAHGIARLASGFSLNAAVAEYRALRASVTLRWDEEIRRQPEQETGLADLIRFNEAIDQAISESVASYSSHNDERVRRFDAILSATPDLCFTYDLGGRVTYANKALMEVIGLPLDKMVGYLNSDLGMPNAAELDRQIQEVIAKQKPLSAEMSYRSTAGPSRWYEYILAPVLNNNGGVEGVAGTSRDITARKADAHALWEKANFDVVTGLPNRLLFWDRLDHEIRHAKRKGVPVALLFIDLDRFKEANDRLGHDAGDQLLGIVAARIRSCVRETDTAARLGGDEFTVILQDSRDAKQVEVVTEKIRQQLARPFTANNQTIDLSASIGVTLYPQDGSTPEQLVKNADRAMYAAKSGGRNRFCFFSANQKRTDDTARTRSRFIAELRLALSRSQLAVVYQPILDLTSGHIVKAEALLRWNHPEMGLLLPAQFIGPAEEAELPDEMKAIEQWVFTEAASRSREWTALFGMPFQVSINMSPMQLAAHFNAVSGDAYLKNVGLAAHNITVDIKERALLIGSSDVIAGIRRLHDAGIDLSVDDFGTDLLSVNQLKQFAVNTIKLDPSLVHDMATEASSGKMLEAISKAHEIGIAVVAEGVETSAQRDWLRTARCDYAQGYFLGEPVAADVFEKLLQAPPAYFM